MKITININLLLLFIVVLASSCKTTHEISNKNLVSGIRFLPKKEHLNLDVKHLDQLTDDQFLERIEYDYTSNCLKNKDSIAIQKMMGIVSIYSVLRLKMVG